MLAFDTLDTYLVVCSFQVLQTSSTVASLEFLPTAAWATLVST